MLKGNSLLTWLHAGEQVWPSCCWLSLGCLLGLSPLPKGWVNKEYKAKTYTWALGFPYVSVLSPTPQISLCLIHISFVGRKITMLSLDFLLPLKFLVWILCGALIAYFLIFKLQLLCCWKNPLLFSQWSLIFVNQNQFGSQTVVCFLFKKSIQN
jgi:hypothetical protein